jgi:hypothetical protein
VASIKEEFIKGINLTKQGNSVYRVFFLVPNTIFKFMDHAGYRTPFAAESPFCNTVSPGGGGPKHFPASITNKL